jgi:XXXCH domain-containing protein
MSHHDENTLSNTWSREDLAARLEELARGLKAGRLEVEGKTWSVPARVAAEVQLKEKKGGLVLKVKCRWATLAEYHAEAREPVVRWQEDFKTLKKRLGAQFRGLKLALAQGRLPDAQTLADFARDSRAMAKMGEPDWDEAMQSYLSHLAALERAVTARDLEAARHELADLERAMAVCHREFK